MEYPLEINSVGSDTYIVMSKGHHGLDEFINKAKQDYPSWHLGGAVHKWCKATPDNSGEFNTVYTFVEKGIRGAFPATYAYEYGDT